MLLIVCFACVCWCVCVCVCEIRHRRLEHDASHLVSEIIRLLFSGSRGGEEAIMVPRDHQSPSLLIQLAHHHHLSGSRRCCSGTITLKWCVMSVRVRSLLESAENTAIAGISSSRDGSILRDKCLQFKPQIMGGKLLELVIIFNSMYRLFNYLLKNRFITQIWWRTLWFSEDLEQNPLQMNVIGKRVSQWIHGNIKLAFYNPPSNQSSNSSNNCKKYKLVFKQTEQYFKRLICNLTK